MRGLVMGRFVVAALLAVVVAVGGQGRSLQAEEVTLQATPAETLIGQQANVCYGGNYFQVMVEQAEWLRSVVGETAPGNAMWVTAVVTALNTGIEDSIPAGTTELRDDRGRQVTPNTDVAFLTLVGEAYGVQQPYIVIGAGLSERMVMVFPVAPDARSFSLVSSNFQCQV